MEFERATWSGLVVAAIGFFLTRFTVTLAVSEGPLRFVAVGLAPLGAGLLLAVFGVALSVGAFPDRFVTTVARWCALGTGLAFALVGFSLLGSSGGVRFEMFRTQPHLANFVIGGALGGTFTGIYAARSRRQSQEVTRRTNRLVFLNRLLRDEILNATATIKGQTTMLGDPDGPSVDRSIAVIKEHAGRIEESIHNVKYLSDPDAFASGSHIQVDLGTALRSSLDTVRTLHPDAAFRVRGEIPDTAVVTANPLLENAFTNLLENGAVYSDADEPLVTVDVDQTDQTVVVTVRDDGPGLPPDQQRLLETGTIAEYDDPTTGFGLNIVRLLVESSRGEVRTHVTDDGTAVTVALPRADGAVAATGPTNPESYRVSTGEVGVAVGAALGAGLLMGVVMQAVAGVMPVIGALYGVDSLVVGWITHEFHSVVFGLAYAGLVGASPGGLDVPVRRYLGLAVVWALALCLFAAGLVMPVWLRLVGVPAPVPNLTLGACVSHLAWGLCLGILVWAGNRYRRAGRGPNRDAGPV